MHKPKYWKEAGHAEIYASIAVGPDGSGYIDLHNEDVAKEDLAEHNQILEQIARCLNTALATGKIKIEQHRMECSRSSLGIQYDTLPDLHIAIKFGNEK